MSAALPPHGFWQVIEPAGSYPTAGPFRDFYPATLSDGRQLRLPIRALPGDGARGVASLICNQASFAVLDALIDMLAERVRPYAPDVIVGVPTLGLPLAEGVARRLGHRRLVPLSTSRKFWYREDLSEPLSSITTPERGKSLYIDPRMLPLLEGKRAVLIDDVASSGQSLTSVLRLLRKAEVIPLAVGVVMEQGDKWRTVLAAEDEAWPGRVTGVFRSPLLRREGEGWVEG
ncbi:MAG: phosphoribosyltransferase [Devosia sp.]|nr:phosphoribosyltransferase [Devosia sp.]